MDRLPPQRRIEVDGVTYYWRAYRTTMRRNRGPEEAIEMLDVGRTPESRGVGRVFPAGTALTDDDAAETVRMFLRDGGEIT